MQTNILKRIKPVLLGATLLFSLSAFSQEKQSSESVRSELIYKQSHSSNQLNQTKLFADGIKLKMDLSVLEEVVEERIMLGDNEIPAEELYGGLWKNNGVNAYSSLTNMPDSFMVDLKHFTIPSGGHITSNFGRRGRRRYHYGIDIKLRTGDTVYAAFDGKVRVTEYQRRGYGYYVVLRHTNGLETVYGHLSKFLVEENEVVVSGQPIALGGNTGRSTGSHLHFETRFLGQPINPNFIIDFENSVCHRDSYTVCSKSFYKTSRSSRVRYNASKDGCKKSSSQANKFVSGKVTYHRIRRGDTLSRIAKRYGTTVTKICKLNNISRRTTIRAGKSLRVS